MTTDRILANNAGKPSTRGFNYDNTNYHTVPTDIHAQFAAQRLIEEGT